MKKIKYIFKIIKWLYAHRDEPNARQKYRRMGRELEIYR